NKALSKETIDVWAFGFEGELSFSNDKILAKSDQPFTEHNFATLLGKLPDDSFPAKDIINKSFEDVQEEAFAGSDYKSHGFFKGLWIELKEFFALNSIIQLIKVGFFYFLLPF